MKKHLFIVFFTNFSTLKIKSLKKIKEKIPTKKPIINVLTTALSATDITNSLKKVHTNSIYKQVTKLTAMEEFFKNELV